MYVFSVDTRVPIFVISINGYPIYVFSVDLALSVIINTHSLYKQEASTTQCSSINVEELPVETHNRFYNLIDLAFIMNRQNESLIESYV